MKEAAGKLFSVKKLPESSVVVTWVTTVIVIPLLIVVRVWGRRRPHLHTHSTLSLQKLANRRIKKIINYDF